MLIHLYSFKGMQKKGWQVGGEKRAIKITRVGFLKRRTRWQENRGCSQALIHTRSSNVLLKALAKLLLFLRNFQNLTEVVTQALIHTRSSNILLKALARLLLFLRTFQNLTEVVTIWNPFWHQACHLLPNPTPTPIRQLNLEPAESVLTPTRSNSPRRTLLGVLQKKRPISFSYASQK